MAAGFVKFETPKELADKIYEAIQLAASTGKVRKGVNETTKSIERGVSKLVVMAEDISPEEILMHIPVICDEKKITYVYVPSKAELGKAAGLEVPTAAVSIDEEGNAKKNIADIASKVSALKK
ncbi:MAG: 50S ribosomal protein L7ae [Candidatus Micrarchaeota archaeon]|nr:50S ribosomal protein L7ae [Candidatus Micrarchaeota archaeon]